MKKEYLCYLCCPECKQSLTVIEDKSEKDNIIEGILVCNNNPNHKYRISNAIPRLIPSSTEQGQLKTAQSFGQKWTTDSVKQYGFSGEILDFHHTWYLQRYGWKTEQNFKSFLKNQKFILDAGCGVGRDVMWFAENTSGLVFGIDISESIDVAQENLCGFNNVLLVQGDLAKVPFKEEFFDFISCDMVIHHTPNTEKSFNHLTKHVKPEGIFSTYTYKVKGPIREFCDDFIREKTTKMNYDECLAFSRSITLLGKAFSDLKQNVEIPEDIPILNIKKGTYDVQRFIYWNIFKCFWNEDHGMEASVMTNFDWYHPKDAHRHSPDELKEWIQKANLEIITFDIGDAGISVRLKKFGC